MSYEQITQRVVKVMADILGADGSTVTKSTSIIDDLGADDLDEVQLVIAFEEEFGIEIPDEVAEKFKVVGDVIDYIELNVGD